MPFSSRSPRMAVGHGDRVAAGACLRRPRRRRSTCPPPTARRSTARSTRRRSATSPRPRARPWSTSRPRRAARSRELTEFFGGGSDDLLQRFFGGQGQPPGKAARPRGRQPRENDAPQQEGTGTGFIIDKSGFILTNNHVVDGADDIRVSLFGGGRTETYAAKVVGHDVLTDTALIQLTEMPAAPLPEVKFGDSEQMQPGDWVMAIGNPFRLSHTVTVGVVIGARPAVRRRAGPRAADAADRRGDQSRQLRRAAAERPRRGRRHEHRDLHRRQRAANIGIGFATPINAIRDLLPQLRNGKVMRGVIGVRVDRDDVSKDVAKAFGLPGPAARCCRSVMPAVRPTRPASQPGDVIVEFNGQPVNDSDALVAWSSRTKPGTTVPVTIYRNNQRKTMNVTVDELDLEAEQGRAGARTARAGRGADRDRLRHGRRTDHAGDGARARAAAQPRRRHRARRRAQQPGRSTPASGRTTSSSRSTSRKCRT